MLFNPAESIDLNGNTGPFIQYTYARIRSVPEKGNKLTNLPHYTGGHSLSKEEKQLLKIIYSYPRWCLKPDKISVLPLSRILHTM